MQEHLVEKQERPREKDHVGCAGAVSQLAGGCIS